DVTRPALAIDDPLARLTTIIRNHTRSIGRSVLDNGAFLSVVVDDSSGLDPEHRRRIDKRKRDYFALLRGTLDALASEGRLTPGVDTTVLAFTLLGMISWIGRWRRPGGRMPLDSVADQILRVALAGAVKAPKHP
ncbi:MAG: hypothetical protein KF897_17460, partial [Opitutaceae bacterium]|nr:hypothetical protein [Opitutaceae bacterium]